MFSGCPIENKENNDNNLYDDNNISFGSYDYLDGFLIILSKTIN